MVCISFLLLCNKLPHTQQLETIPFDDLKVSVGQKSRQWYNWVLCARSHRAEIKGSVRLSSYLEALERIYIQVHSCGWKNLLSPGFRTDIPLSLLTSTRGLSQLLKATYVPSHKASCILHMESFSQHHSQQQNPCVKSIPTL